MVYDSRYIIAATDICAQSNVPNRFRGKTAKEIYRCAKGVALSGQVVGPVVYTLRTVPNQLTGGLVKAAVRKTSTIVISYVSGMSLAGTLYQLVNNGLIKTTARLIYNYGGLFMTLPAYGFTVGMRFPFSVLSLSALEKYWFGEEVYIFDDNRIWLEKNFTIEDTFRIMQEGTLDND
jgi:hypothetical protein